MQPLLITGDNYVAITSTLTDITSAFDTRINLDLKEDSLEDVQTAATATSLFGDKQVVVVRNPLSVNYEQLAQLLEDGVGNQVVLLDSPPQLDKRKKGYKKLAKICKVTTLKQPSDREVIGWVINTAKDYNLSFNNTTARTLVEVAGNDTNHLASELQKLTFADEINEDTIRKYCASPQQLDIFNLLDVIFTGSQQRAEAAVKQYFSNPRSDAHYLLSMISWQLRQAVNVWVNNNGGSVKVSSYQVRKLQPFVRGKSKQDIQQYVTYVAEYDEMLKTKGHERDVVAETALLVQRLVT